jgi:dTDP-4-amino-4,6-dideoxygalactose transaminase
VPPYTFIATATAVARMGGTPVFADVDASWCLDPDAVERAISPRTRAIVPVHFGGRFADMDRLLEIAGRHGLTVFEDACHTWGGRWKDKGAGTLGIGGAFSFQMSKNITSAEGGAIVSDDGAFAEICESICNCGRGQGGAWYRHDRVGTNARITEFQAALLNAQMPRVPGQIDLREKNGAMLDAALSAIEGIEPQPGDDRITRRSYHLYCFKVDPFRFGCSREHLIAAAEAEGLDISGGYGVPIYRQPAFAEGRHAARYAAVHCPVAEDLCARSAMWLPHQILLGSPSDMEDIVAILQKIKRHAHRLAEG